MKCATGAGWPGQAPRAPESAQGGRPKCRARRGASRGREGGEREIDRFLTRRNCHGTLPRGQGSAHGHRETPSLPGGPRAGARSGGAHAHAFAIRDANAGACSGPRKAPAAGCKGAEIKAARFGGKIRRDPSPRASSRKSNRYPDHRDAQEAGSAPRLGTPTPRLTASGSRDVLQVSERLLGRRGTEVGRHLHLRLRHRARAAPAHRAGLGVARRPGPRRVAPGGAGGASAARCEEGHGRQQRIACRAGLWWRGGAAGTLMSPRISLLAFTDGPGQAPAVKHSCVVGTHDSCFRKTAMVARPAA